MGEDASLDQFLPDESDEQHSEPAEEPEPTASEAGGEQSETDAATEAPDASPGDDTEPAATTYAWDGAGEACADCGEPVERRWQQDGDLVCIECKDWERA